MHTKQKQGVAVTEQVGLTAYGRGLVEPHASTIVVTMRAKNAIKTCPLCLTPKTLDMKSKFRLAETHKSIIGGTSVPTSSH